MFGNVSFSSAVNRSTTTALFRLSNTQARYSFAFISSTQAAMRYLAGLILFIALIGLMHAKIVINATKLSSARSAVGAIQGGNKIFFAAGFENNDWIASDVVNIFNLDTMEFQGNETLPHPRANLVPVVLDQHIYFIGGNDYNNKPYIYDPTSRNFTRSAVDLLKIRQNITDISLYKSVLTVVGTSGIELYNITGDNWINPSSLKDTLQSLIGPLIIPKENFIFILGGQNKSTDQPSNTLYIFNIDTNSMTTRTAAEIQVNTSNTDNPITYYYNNVLFVHQANMTMLYHVARDQFYFETRAPDIYSFVTSTTNTTYMFAGSMRGILIHSWSSDSTGSVSKVANFYHAFGYGEYAGYIEKNLALQQAFIYVAWEEGLLQIATSGTDIDRLNWTGDLIGYDWPPNKHIVSDGNNTLIINMEGLTSAVLTFGTINKMFVQQDTVYIFTSAADDCWISIQEAALNDYTVQSYSCFEAPDLMFGDQLLYLTLGFSRQWPLSEKTPFNPIEMNALMTAQNDEHLIMMYNEPQMTLSGIIDVYNHVNDTWLDPIEMPYPITGDQYNNIISMALNDSIQVWFHASQFEIDAPGRYALLNPDVLGKQNLVIGNSWQYPVHTQLAVILGTNVYMKASNSAQFLRVYNVDSNTWDTTKEFPVDFQPLEPMQLFLYNHVIYMVAQNTQFEYFDYVFVYDTDAKDWQITRPDQQRPQTSVTAAKVGDFLALLTSNSKIYSLHLPSGIWIDEDWSDMLSFSSVVQSDSITFVSGATSMIDGTYSDVVLLLTDDGTVPPQAHTGPGNQPGVDGQEASSTLIIAVVVPIGAVVIAGALLAFFLVRRHKKRKRGVETTVGLETKYGQWFIPFDQIKFGDKIGQGGNGQVFKGTWNNTTVALKVSMTQANSSVIDELKLMMQLRPHPNVVQLFGFSEHPETNSVILVIEYCDQGSLDSELMDSGEHITDEQKLKYIVGAAKGLSHLHSNHIVHRDVAARNVLLHQHEPKITDFGLSRALDDENKKGTTRSELGPIRWMAPEALKNKEYSTKSDVWSFGVLMYEIIAQQEPHIDADPIEIGRLIRDNGLTPTIPASCPSYLSTIMKQCWNMDPDQRPSIDQILGQLEEH